MTKHLLFKISIFKKGSEENGELDLVEAQSRRNHSSTGTIVCIVNGRNIWMESSDLEDVRF